MHTEVIWLSRMFSLRKELCIFLSDKRPDLAEYLSDEKWVAQLSYLADIFSETIKLNKTTQGAKTAYPSLNESRHSKENNAKFMPL